MTQPSPLEDFLQQLQIENGAPASEAELERLESVFPLGVPAAVRGLYLSCNGGRARGDGSELQLLSVTDALAYRDAGLLSGSFWGYLPIAENNDSNPVCVCCASPLVGFVAIVSHDDDARLLGRSLDAFYRSAIDVARSGDLFETNDLRSELDVPERTDDDSRIARELIDLGVQATTLDRRTRTDALRFACDLLADDDVAEMGHLVDVGDEYVREHVVRRLKLISVRTGDTKAGDVLRDLDGDYRQFVDRCATLLRQEGFQVTVKRSQEELSIRIDPGPIHLNLAMMYSKRREPDFEQFLVERVKALAARKKG